VSNNNISGPEIKMNNSPQLGAKSQLDGKVVLNPEKNKVSS
jgi:hypothetical protein